MNYGEAVLLAGRQSRGRTSRTSNDDRFVFHRFFLCGGPVAFPLATVDEKDYSGEYVDDGCEDGKSEGIAEVMCGASRVPRSQVILFVSY